MFAVFYVDNLSAKLDDKTKELKQKLDVTEKKVEEILNQTLGFEQNNYLFTELRPALEQITKTCLSRHSEQKCNVGDINCTWINLFNNKLDCIMCVDGKETSLTDDGSKDYCPHNVHVETTHLNITVEHEKLKFTTRNGKIATSSAKKTNYQVKDKEDCECFWAFYAYKSFANTSDTDPIQNELLRCNCDQEEWRLCPKTGNENEVICDKPSATCHLQANEQVNLYCIPDGFLQNKATVRIANTCQFDTTQSIACNFTWYLDPISIVYNSSNVYFDVEWNNKIEIKNFSCSGVVCKGGADYCKVEHKEEKYTYNFFTCKINKQKILKKDQPPTSESSDATPSTWLILIIVVLVVVFLLYVGYQNYQKVSFICRCKCDIKCPCLHLQ